MGFLFGGDSTSKTANTSNDARVVGGNGSTNTSTVVSGDGNAITLTDAGAVHESLALALAGVTQANQTTQAVVASNGNLLTDALGTQAKQQAAFTSSLENIKTADVRILVAVGLAVLGLAFIRRKQPAA